MGQREKGQQMDQSGWGVHKGDTRVTSAVSQPKVHRSR